MTAKLNYQIHPGPFHRGGQATIETLTTKDSYQVTLTYAIEKKGPVPLPKHFLSGSVIFELPHLFHDEKGYLELEERKVMMLPKAKLSHLGRRSSYQWNDAHFLEVVLTNGKGSGEILYHPSVPGCGWTEIKLTLHLPFPFLESYSLNADLIDN